jgi:hypothetical protein
MFTKEIDMQDILYKKMKKHCNKNKIVLKEFNGRFGNVDIVEVFLADKKISKEQAHLLSQNKYAITLAYLHKKSPRTLNYLIHKNFNSVKMQKNILKQLIQYNIVTEIKSGVYLINENFEYPKIKFISYELKLFDWEKAILQAIKNKDFSEYSWVVLPEEIYNDKLINNNEFYKIFKTNAIGLKTLNSKGHFKTIIKAKRTNKFATKNYEYIVSLAKLNFQI